LLEHGPDASLATLSRAVGLSPPALLKRFGSKQRLVFRALLPTGPPAWVSLLASPPGEQPAASLVALLCSLAAEFADVGPALAALRMSPTDVDEVFPPGASSPPLRLRARLGDWLGDAGVAHAPVRADALVGAAEARGFLRWVSPALVDDRDDTVWAAELVHAVLGWSIAS
jgi:AcrR family transcriptional regulator